MPVPSHPALTPFIAPGPNRGQDEEEFDTNQQNFVHSQFNNVTEQNTLAEWTKETADFTEEKANAAEASAQEAAGSEDRVTALVGGFNSGNQGSWPTVITLRNDGSALQQGDTFFYTGGSGGGYVQNTSYSWNDTLNQWEVAPMPGVFVTKTQLITASTTWIKPPKFLEGSLLIDGIGSGSSGNSSTLGIGGGSGEYVIGASVDVSAVSVVSVTISPAGAAVNGGGVSAAGNPGGACSFGALLVLSGGIAPNATTAPGSSVGGTWGGIANATSLVYAQANPSAKGGVGGVMLSTVSNTVSSGGGGGLIFDDSGIAGGSVTNTGGGRGYGAGGAGASSNASASGAGAPGAFFLTWQEYR